MDFGNDNFGANQVTFFIWLSRELLLYNIDLLALQKLIIIKEEVVIFQQLLHSGKFLKMSRTLRYCSSCSSCFSHCAALLVLTLDLFYVKNSARIFKLIILLPLQRIHSKDSAPERLLRRWSGQKPLFVFLLLRDIWCEHSSGQFSALAKNTVLIIECATSHLPAEKWVFLREVAFIIRKHRKGHKRKL